MAPSSFKLILIPPDIASQSPSHHYATDSKNPIYIRQAILRLLHSSDDPTLTRLFSPTHVHASTSHSYHTRVSSVCRHMLTSSSVSAGKYRGCCVTLLVLTLRLCTS